MTAFRLGEIARRIGGELRGDPELVITRIRSVDQASEQEIAVITNHRYRSSVDTLGAAALVIPADTPVSRSNVILSVNPRESFLTLLEIFAADRDVALPGIHETALVSPQAEVSFRAHIGPMAVVEAGARIGARVVIHAGVYVGKGTIIGDESIIFPNVTLYAGTRIGRRVRIHSGTVIGGDGFGYEKDDTGTYRKVAQLGRVEIGDDVEIGANCAIDRATLEATTIGAGTRIDNLVQIGHNSEIGEKCCIISQVGISGSVRIGSYTVLSGQVGVADHVSIGEGTVVGAKSGVHSDLGGGLWLGSPVMPVERARRVYPIIQSLPEYRERVRQLETQATAMNERIALLESRLAEMLTSGAPLHEKS